LLLFCYRLALFWPATIKRCRSAAPRSPGCLHQPRAGHLLLFVSYFSLFLQKSGSAVNGLIWSNIVGVVAGMVAFSGFRSITKINLAGV
jgi:hypothetical protein